MERHYYESAIGWLEIEASGDAITGLRFVSQPQEVKPSDSKVILQCCKELDEYFRKERKTFDVKIATKGTEFQGKVWDNLLRIPYGKTISYATLAGSAGNPKAYRAAGSANGKNPIAIIVPCHRVINSGGGLGGYAYGLEIKKKLLDLEQ